MSQAHPTVPHLHLLGVARLPSPHTGADLQLQYRKGWALLGYLAVERGRRHPREQLAAMLWPDLDGTAARTNLRQVLGNLQQAFRVLGLGELLHADKNSIGLVPRDPSAVLFDIDLLDPLIIDEGDAVELLADLPGWQLRGAFLEGVSVPGSADFEDWLAFTREHFQRRAVRLMCRLRDHLHGRDNRSGAIDVAWRIVQADAWNESHHRTLMVLLAEDGSPHEVQRVFAGLERSLHRHLDCMPSSETRELYARLMQHPR